MREASKVQCSIVLKKSEHMYNNFRTYGEEQTVKYTIGREKRKAKMSDVVAS